MVAGGDGSAGGGGSAERFEPDCFCILLIHPQTVNLRQFDSLNYLLLFRDNIAESCF
jgi:hypothetical protein